MANKKRKILTEPWKPEDMCGWILPLKPEDAHEFAYYAIGALHAAHKVIDALLTTRGCEYSLVSDYGASVKQVLEYAVSEELTQAAALDYLDNSDWPMDDD